MDKIKPVLAIETSQSLCSACIYFSEEKYFEANFRLKNAHAEKLFNTIDLVMKLSGTEIKELEFIAVSSGPGSFTGLRIGMSAAKGIGFGSSKPIIPVPTFEALAYQISKYVPDNTEFIIANRVNIEEIYFAEYLFKSGKINIIENLQVLRKEELTDKVRDILIFGNALLDSGNDLSNIKPIYSPSAHFVAEWSKYYGKDKIITDYDYIEPNYLKNFIIKERKNV